MKNLTRTMLAGGLIAGLAISTVSAESIDEARPAAADGRIEFEAVTGDFEIIGHDAEEFLLSGDLGDDVEELVIEGDADHWKIRLEMKEGENRGMGWSSSDLRLLVPRGTDLGADTVSADLVLRELNGPSVGARSVSGDIDLAGVRPGELGVRTVSGDIVTDAGGTEVTRLQSVSGDLELSDGHGRIGVKSVSGEIEMQGTEVSEFEAETVSGDIVARLDPVERARVSVTSHSGDVELFLPSETALRLEAETFSGSIESGFGGERSGGYGPGEKLSLDGGAGSVEVDARSFSGSIRIRGEN
ncbi:MAG: DUF4097 family beta strand repeat-containing protein [Candidatus Wenzhouxiangella sp. M2_3B_020]